MARYASLALAAISAVLAAWPALALSGRTPSPVAHVIEEGYRLFFAGHYDQAAAFALASRSAPDAELASFELRTSALHFRIKREVAGARDKKVALERCAPCAGLLAELGTDIAAGRALAKTTLAADAANIEARFYLGKINLTHVWLHLETLGRRTGWGEYWEARRSLDAVLERQPHHLRARVSRAWINYIVDTRVPWGVRWMLGGGDRKGALAAAAAAAKAEGDSVATAEARFALWEMLMREGRKDEALVVARQLYETFPENVDLERAIAAGR